MEIDSPPFPKSSTSPAQMYHTLSELYDWTTNQKEWANMEGSRLNAPEQPFIPELGPYPSGSPDRYLTLAVPDMFVSWKAMRAIREKYDDIVRNYEDEEDWTGDACIFHRINIVKMSAMLLSVAFLDREKREAKEMELIKKQRKEFFQGLKSVLGDMKGFFGGDQDNDDEIDSLFNPPDEE